MKTIILTILTLVVSGAVLAAAKITAVQNNGKWQNASTWDLNRMPSDDDTIIIPANVTVKLEQLHTINKVYIKVYGIINMNGGKLDLDTSSTMVVFSGGMISGVTNGDQIRIGNVHKFKGGAAPIVGPAYANESTGSYPLGFSVFDGTLAVTLLSFDVMNLKTSVQLSWKTTEEMNNSHFELQRSIDGRNFKAIAVVFANPGSYAANQYQYIDKITVTGTFYYRLKQIDKDGNFMYSVVKTVQAENSVSKTKIYSSGQKSIFIEFCGDIKSKVSVCIYNANGQAVHRMFIYKSSYRTEIQLPMAPSGIYIVDLTNETSKTEVKKILL